MTSTSLPRTRPQALPEFLVGRGSPRVARRFADRSKSFAEKKVAYVLELAGSCMLIAVFLAMALFL